MLGHVRFAFVHVLDETLEIFKVDVLHKHHRVFVVQEGRTKERLQRAKVVKLNTDDGRRVFSIEAAGF